MKKEKPPKRKIDLFAFKKQPHDKYAKFVLQTKEVVLELLQFCLPEILLEQISPESLELSQDSYVDTYLQTHFTDVCYRGQTRAKKPLRIAIIFEHKSEKPKGPVTEQLLRYISNVWNTDLKQKRALSLTIPIVLYHGKQSWQKESSESLFPDATEEQLRFVPSFEYVMVDIQRIADEQPDLASYSFLRNIFLALKYSRNSAYVHQFWQKIVIFAPQNSGKDIRLMLIQATVTYLTYASNTFKQKLNDMNTAAEIQQHPEVKSILEELYEQGMEKGMEEGITKGMENLLTAFMRNNPEMTDKHIADAMDVEERFVAAVRKKQLSK